MKSKCPIGWGNRHGYVKLKCRCHVCSGASREYNKKYFSTSRGKKIRDRVSRDRYIRVTKKINEIKLKTGCIDCGFKKHPSALHFDHVRGKKKFTIGQIRTYRWGTILKEIGKCEVRCANCHSIRTAEFWKKKNEK